MSENDHFRRSRWRGDENKETEDLVDTRSWRASQDVVGRQIPLLWFIVAEPLDNRGIVLPIKSGEIIGRKGEVRWGDPRMSREHARVHLVNHPDDPTHQIYAIEPLNDRNGTYINGHSIDRMTILLENDAVMMGDTLFVVKVLA